jgi:hypothetical protein
VRRIRSATLVLCLFILYCVLLSQGLKANALSTFFGALAAVPLTVHLYNRLLPGVVETKAQRDSHQYSTLCRGSAPSGSERSSGQPNSVVGE